MRTTTDETGAIHVFTEADLERRLRLLQADGREPYCVVMNEHLRRVLKQQRPRGLPIYGEYEFQHAACRIQCKRGGDDYMGMPPDSMCGKVR